MHKAGSDESYDCGPIHQHYDKNFQAVHEPDVTQPKKSENGEHEDANSAAEIAAIDRDDRLYGENSGTAQPELLPASRHEIPGRENSRREKNEPGHHPAEECLWRNEKQNAPKESANKTDR